MKKLIGSIMIAFAAIGFSNGADAQTIVRERTVVHRHHTNYMAPAPVSVTVRTHPRGHAYGYYRNREFYGYRNHDHFRTTTTRFHGPVTTRRTVIYR